MNRTTTTVLLAFGLAFTGAVLAPIAAAGIPDPITFEHDWRCGYPGAFPDNDVPGTVAYEQRWVDCSLEHVG